jgi:hypothetical protein
MKGMPIASAPAVPPSAMKLRLLKSIFSSPERIAALLAILALIMHIISCLAPVKAQETAR